VEAANLTVALTGASAAIFGRELFLAFEVVPTGLGWVVHWQPTPR
jgi:hypothetical protein